MGYKELEIKVPTSVSEGELEKQIQKVSGLKTFTYKILKKSLDARNKRNIYWQFRIGIHSKAIKSGEKPVQKNIDSERKNYKDRVIIAGSGPAGIFSAIALAKAGMKVVLIERGSQVIERKKSIQNFENTGNFDENNNYSFGEGGAGTFSDGKLTSRTKGISAERNFIFDTFIQAGAPKEISYMSHPHLGSDNLIHITSNLRKIFIELGGEMHFNTLLTDLKTVNSKIQKIYTNNGEFEGQHFILATGHSSYETFRMLIKNGVPFRPKNFAIGMRAEHPQSLINQAQWGKPKLEGVKAAEYRLSSQGNANNPVYSFCMCPGGIIVPATAYANTNIVNGMSLYLRNNFWANAAVVAGVHPSELLNKDEPSANEVLDWLESLENSFYKCSNSFKAPSIRINDFINGKSSSQDLPESSYPFGLLTSDIHALLPKKIRIAMMEGLKEFSKKIKGYESGILVGLESKTSAPIQVLRDKELYTAGFSNLYFAGEGSGWAGGIISSAADGLKAGLQILKIAK